MITRRQANTGLLATAAAAAPALATAEQSKAITLPPPRKEGGEPLLRALKLRRSTREYSDRKLPPQVLSDLLWAAFGINRSSGDRTAPYWRHVMVIDVYAAMEDGVCYTSPNPTPCSRICPRTFVQRPGFRTLSAPRHLILFMSHMASA